MMRLFVDDDREDPPDMSLEELNNSLFPPLAEVRVLKSPKWANLSDNLIANNDDRIIRAVREKFLFKCLEFRMGRIPVMVVFDDNAGKPQITSIGIYPIVHDVVAGLVYVEAKAWHVIIVPRRDSLARAPKT